MNRWTKNMAGAASLSLALGTTALAAMAAQGALRSYYANDPAGRNVVIIESRAPLETIVTTTNAVTASISGDPKDIFKTGRARVEVDVAKLDTGIDMRNEHMRAEKWLNTEKYPKAVFNLTRLVQIDRSRNNELKDNETRVVMAEGTLELRGKTNPIQARVELTAIPASEETKARLDGDLLHIRATFPIKLTDYGLDLPAMVRPKIADVENVTVDVFANTKAENPFPEAATVANNQTEIKMDSPKPVTTLVKEDLKVGDGAEAKAGQRVTVHYRGTLLDGTVFDESYKRGEPFTFNLGAGQVIKGWDQGVAGMKIGGKRRLTIPADLAYGSRGAGGVIPPNAALVFEVELLKVS